MKKMLMLCILALTVFSFGIIGFAQPAPACNGNHCPPTAVVVNDGASYIVQGPSVGLTGSAVIGGNCGGWCGPSFGFLNLGGALSHGHGMVGGTNTFVSVSPGRTHGLTVNGNVYNQGWATGNRVNVQSGAWFNDINMVNVNTHERNVRTSAPHHDTSRNVFDSTITRTRGTDFGAVTTGTLRGPGAFQGQAGMNYTRINW